MGSTIHDQLLAQRFPDLAMQRQNPAPSRLAHDKHATDPGLRFQPRSICDRFIAGPGAMDPNHEISWTDYVECRRQLDSIIVSAYELSPTFRRLFNRAWDVSLQYPEQRWLIDAGKMFGTTTTEAHIACAGGRRVISLNMDTPHLFDAATYISQRGAEQLDWTRSCMHEVIHALTALQDDCGDDHPRGGIVEYTNNVLKEMGHHGAARSQYALLSPEPASVGNPPIQMFEGVRKGPALKLDLKQTSSNAAPDEGSSRQRQEPRSIPLSVTRALERVLPESSPNAAKELDGHLRRSQNYIDQQLQPDAEILKHDSSTIANVIRIENSRKATLNLTLCDSICDVIALLETEPAPSHKRFIFKEASIGRHYSFADISIKPGTPASIILFESADLGSLRAYALYERFARAVRNSPTLSDSRISIIDVNVQRSPADCLIFCLSFALKSYKHADLFTKWHDAQHADLPIAQPQHEGKAILFLEMGFNIYPSSFLPVDFIKHTHSRAIIGKRLSFLRARNNSTRNMLTQKFLAVEQRFTEKGARNYLPSIEYKRRDLIARTLNIMIAPSDNADINTTW